MQPGNAGTGFFDVHGLRFSVSGDWQDVVEAVHRDFAWFQVEEARFEPHIRVEIAQRKPDLDAYGSVRAAQVTEQQVVYRLGNRTVIDHLGVVCSLIDAGGTGLDVQGEDPHVARRIAFDFLLARIGDHLDLRGMPRVYGLGLSGQDGAVLVMLPRGGGKTTLALRALQEPGIRFFSEVSPLLDRRGFLYPFPFPLWVRVNSPEAEDLPARYVRRMGGEQTNPRLLELEAFWTQIASEPEPLRHIVIGERSLGRESSLDCLSRNDAVAPLFRLSVASFSLTDAVRFGVRRADRQRPLVADDEATAARALPRVSPLRRVAVRARCCWAGLRGASVWRLTLGRDREGNWQALERLLR